MKIITKIGNLMDVQSGHIVHGCNAHGVMGSGVALAVKKTYPAVYKDYAERTLAGGPGLLLGEAYPVVVSPYLMIWNAITQQDFGTCQRQVDYEAVATCFEQIQRHIDSGLEGVANMQPNEIHIPAIGAGLGGGNWEIIREIIEQTTTSPVTLWVLQ